MQKTDGSGSSSWCPWVLKSGAYAFVWPHQYDDLMSLLSRRKDELDRLHPEQDWGLHSSNVIISASLKSRLPIYMGTKREELLGAIPMAPRPRSLQPAQQKPLLLQYSFPEAVPCFIVNDIDLFRIALARITEGATGADRFDERHPRELHAGARNFGDTNGCPTLTSEIQQCGGLQRQTTAEKFETEVRAFVRDESDTNNLTTPPAERRDRSAVDSEIFAFLWLLIWQILGLEKLKFLDYIVKLKYQISRNMILKLIACQSRLAQGPCIQEETW